MPKSKYIVHFVASHKDPRFEEPQLENHLYLVTMTQDQADGFEQSLQRMFDEGFVRIFSVALAEAVRITPMDLRRRLKYYRK